MKTKEEIKQLAKEKCTTLYNGFFGYIDGYTQCQEDMATTKEFMSKETLDEFFDLHDDDDFIDGDSDNSKVTRFEVIDENGRVYTKHNCTLELSYQDNSRTLKVFIKNKQD
jgi:hypothetical protein